jgi:Zn ribbon nucleic-acid-binding protein
VKIKTILTQSRRDFTATLECEHCGHEEHLSTGYDDDNYHRNVIPSIECVKCGKKAPDSFRPLTTKYDAHQIV